MKTRAKRFCSTKKWLLSAALLTLTTTLAPPHVASQQSERNGTVLHEFFDPSQQIIGWPAARPSNASQPTSSTQPPHVAGQPPALSLEINDQEPIFTQDGPLFESPLKQPNGPLDPRASTNQLDDLTDHVDPLEYFPQFDPSVIPYKRQVAQNKVVRSTDGIYQIELASENFTPVDIPTDGRTTKSSQEDAFWGTFLIRTQPGQLQPIPSVSPDQRILQIQTEPAVALTIVHDEADNFFIQTDYTGLVRVNMQLAAPRFYFDGKLQTSLRWTDFPPSLRPTLAPEILTVANRVLTQLAINNQQMSPHEALMRLIEHFRDFESRALPRSAHTGDLFETLALGKAGVCRHRSHAFIITAHALGIPTRFIYNETHAFVEIYWPAQGWRRIDLGGAAENVEIHDNNANLPLHDATLNDPLPQPPAYISERDRILGQTADSSDPNQTADDDSNLDNASASQTAQNDHDPETSQSDHLSNQLPDNLTADAASESAHEHLDTPESDANTRSTASTGDIETTGFSRRQPTQIKITSANQQVLRGHAIAIQGRLTTHHGEPIANQEIKIMLGSVGSPNAKSATLLGTAKTDIDGRFASQFPIPPNLSIGRWTLTAVFDGAPRLQPSTSAP